MTKAYTLIPNNDYANQIWINDTSSLTRRLWVIIDGIQRQLQNPRTKKICKNNAQEFSINTFLVLNFHLPFSSIPSPSHLGGYCCGKFAKNPPTPYLFSLNNCIKEWEKVDGKVIFQSFFTHPPPPKTPLRLPNKAIKFSNICPIPLHTPTYHPFSHTTKTVGSSFQFSF